MEGPAEVVTYITARRHILWDACSMPPVLKITRAVVKKTRAALLTLPRHRHGRGKKCRALTPSAERMPRVFDNEPLREGRPSETPGASCGQARTTHATRQQGGCSAGAPRDTRTHPLEWDAGSPAVAVVVLNWKQPVCFGAVWARSQFRVVADGGADRVFHDVAASYVARSQREGVFADLATVRKRLMPDLVCGDLDSISTEAGEFYKREGVEGEPQGGAQASGSAPATREGIPAARARPSPQCAT